MRLDSPLGYGFLFSPSGKINPLGMKPSIIAHKGFTLVELLVSIIIISVMLVLASVALRNMLLSWNRLAVPYPKEALAFHRLQSAVHSLMPYANLQSDGYGSNLDIMAFYFDGSKDSCTFITSSPLFGKGPALVRIYLKENQLMVAETVLYSKNSDYQNPEENKTTSHFVFADDVRTLQFEYQEQKWKNPELEYPYPTLLRINLEMMDGTVTSYSFCIRSDYPEKLQMMQKMDQDA